MIERHPIDNSSLPAVPRELEPEPDVRQFGNAKIDFSRFELTVRDQTHDLTTMEVQLLRYFLDNDGKVLSRSQILEDVWGSDSNVMPRTIDNFVLRLRKLIEPNLSAPRTSCPCEAPATASSPSRKRNVADAASVGHEVTSSFSWPSFSEPLLLPLLPHRGPQIRRRRDRSQRSRRCRWTPCRDQTRAFRRFFEVVGLFGARIYPFAFKGVEIFFLETVTTRSLGCFNFSLGGIGFGFLASFNFLRLLVFVGIVVERRRVQQRPNNGQQQYEQSRRDDGSAQQRLVPKIVPRDGENASQQIAQDASRHRGHERQQNQMQLSHGRFPARSDGKSHDIKLDGAVSTGQEPDRTTPLRVFDFGATTDPACENFSPLVPHE